MDFTSTRPSTPASAAARSDLGVAEAFGAFATTLASALGELPCAPSVTARAGEVWPAIAADLGSLYGEHAAALTGVLARLIADHARHRSSDLHALDDRRSHAPDWFQQPSMIGYVCYADLFAGDLPGVVGHLDYLQELGVTYLHLMPLLQPRQGENDGGYAVADYEQVDSRLGTMDDLDALAAQLRARGMSLCVDMVMNHTAEEHRWAKAARAGDGDARSWYFMFPDRTLPDQYEQTLRKVFPEWAPGNFTWLPDCEQWVWTTFNEYQWDLNWSNPSVFVAMLDAMLKLSNRGVEVLRLDAVPFLWKQLGTVCENLPQAHLLLQALRGIMQIASPACVFKAEAIVAPELVKPYLGSTDPEVLECDLAYHNQLMVMLWSGLATRNTQLMTAALSRIGHIPHHAGWVTYVRCHDDIGWAVTDHDAWLVGWEGPSHRRFLNDFYSGAFEGSFARGALFQRNEQTGDARISGTAASLCGIEAALESGDAEALDRACRRLELAYAAAFAYSGVPLIYMGDELGLRNDPTFVLDPDHADDNRWLHRPHMDWAAAERRTLAGSLEARLFGFVARLGAVRASIGELHGGGESHVISLDNQNLFCFGRAGVDGSVGRRRFVMVANFGEYHETVDLGRLPSDGSRVSVELASAGASVSSGQVTLTPLAFAWLRVG